MLSANPALTVAQVREILKETAEEWGAPGQDVDYGWGRLNGYAAVKRAGNFATGTPPAAPGHATFTGRIATSGGRAEHTFTVTDASLPVAATMIMPGWTGGSSPDLDLYVLNPDGSELGRSTGGSRQEQVWQPITQTGTYKLIVRSYAGTGDYLVDVSAGTNGPADQPPEVTVEAPEEGATLSGTYSVKIRAIDDVRVANVMIAIDGGSFSDITGTFDGTHYSYALRTTELSDGAHRLVARARDSSGKETEVTRNFRVANGGNRHEVTRTGQVSGSAKDANVTIDVTQTGYVDLTLSWSTSADLDLYVYAPDGTFIGRAYTLNNPERFRIDTDRWGAGTYRVRVNLYDGPTTSFSVNAKGYRTHTYGGSVSAAAPNAEQTHPITYTGRGRVQLSWAGGSDLDLYVYDPAGAERAKGFTLNNPEQVDVPMDQTGNWKVRVNLYSGSGGAFTLRIFAPDAVLA